MEVGKFRAAASSFFLIFKAFAATFEEFSSVDLGIANNR